MPNVEQAFSRCNGSLLSSYVRVEVADDCALDTGVDASWEGCRIKERSCMLSCESRRRLFHSSTSPTAGVAGPSLDEDVSRSRFQWAFIVLVGLFWWSSVPLFSCVSSKSARDLCRESGSLDLRLRLCCQVPCSCQIMLFLRGKYFLRGKIGGVNSLQ
jgi:hypothetical protein